MQEKAEGSDFPGRFREIVADPLNLLIRRHPRAGMIEGDHVTLHNGNRVWVRGPMAYYHQFSDILVINRGVHEPLEELAFQEMLPHLPATPVMLELGAYWAHYSMWLKRAVPGARLVMIEPDPDNAAAGRANLALNGMAGEYREAFVGQGQFEVDAWMAETGLQRLDILHSDIQGHEVEMLDGARRTLAEKRVGYCFVSTHSQPLHQAVHAALHAAGYRIEVSADFDHQTTSFDGFLLAVHPDRPAVLPGPAPLGREEIARADPRALINSLLPRLAVGVGADGEA